jgi:hypothetical protein
MLYPPGVLGPYMELYEAEVDRFINYLRALDQNDLQAQATFAETTISIPKILTHVAHAGMAYAEDARGVIKGLEAKQKFTLNPDPIEAVLAIVPRMRDALDGAWDRTESELSKMIIDTPWGQKFSLDQMMEHAIVHIPWHHRQCKRVIASAKAGK